MKIAIAGYGIEGRANFDYWNTDDNELTIVDERSELDTLPAGVTTMLGSDVFSRLDRFDLVIRTAGLSPSKIKTDGKIWSSTNEFFAKCPAPIIGVTGTKGKGTTSSLIASILRAAGKTVHLVGNIGISPLGALPVIEPDHIVVFEMSSFQLWDIEKSPHVAVVLGIEPDHLDVHDDMEDYVQAKSNIAVYQTDRDVIVYNKNNELSTTIAQVSAGKKVAYPFSIDEFRTSIHLPGEHNVENASAAIAAVAEYVNDPETIKRGLSSFDGLPHRLKFIREVDGVKYYDDSISTTPGSAIAAINSFDEPKVLILGGSDKGSDYSDLYKTIRSSHSMGAIITMGANGTQIADALREYMPNARAIHDKSNTDFYNIMKAAEAVAQPGDVVILSPAAASFDMFKNYADRGSQFVDAVKSL